MYSKLLEFNTGKVERVGFILNDGEIVEVENICDKPEEGFEVSPEDIIQFSDRMIATWHTHPDESANLSTNDYENYLEWPHLEHYIIGTNGVAKYVVEDGDVILVT